MQITIELVTKVPSNVALLNRNHWVHYGSQHIHLTGRRSKLILGSMMKGTKCHGQVQCRHGKLSQIAQSQYELSIVSFHNSRLTQVLQLLVWIQRPGDLIVIGPGMPHMVRLQ